MKIGDRVRVKGLLDKHGSLVTDKCFGKEGTIVAKGILFPYVVKFDFPVLYDGDKYWDNIPFYEAELELIC